MKNNTDLFLRYYDNNLSHEEKMNFEEKLNTESQFNSEYESFLLSLKIIKKEVEVDERYFSTLIPRARERNRRIKSKTYKILRYAYILPIVIVGAFLVYDYNSDHSSDLDYNFQELMDEFLDNEELALNVIEESYLSDDLILYKSEYYQDLYGENYEIDESFFDYAENNLYPSDIDREFLNNLNEQEFNNIYDKLLEKKIVGE